MIHEFVNSPYSELSTFVLIRFKPKLSDTVTLRERNRFRRTQLASLLRNKDKTCFQFRSEIRTAFVAVLAAIKVGFGGVYVVWVLVELWFCLLKGRKI